MKKYKPKEGDLFRYLITDAASNDGFAVYGYGRVLDDTTAAFYSNSALPFTKRGVTDNLEDILLLDVAFIVGCTFDGFYSGLYEVIASLPLENKFKQPIYFYHRSVAENMCRVFNIWEPGKYGTLDIREVPVHIERWGAHGHIHIEKRLGIYRG
jgi:hypothetical protein